MIETVALAAFASAGLHFAIYQKQIIKPNNFALYRHWQCGFCFCFWGGVIAAFVQHQNLYGVAWSIPYGLASAFLGMLLLSIDEFFHSATQRNLKENE